MVLTSFGESQSIQCLIILKQGSGVYRDQSDMYGVRDASCNKPLNES